MAAAEANRRMVYHPFGETKLQTALPDFVQRVDENNITGTKSLGVTSF
jgi:hypothetical protein